MTKINLGLIIAVMLALANRLAAAVIVNLDPATANYSGGAVDDGSVTGSQSGIPLPTASLGLSWNIECTPAAGDLTGTVLLVEMGGNANGTGLFLISGVPTFASKQAGTASRIPESPLPDLDFADQPGGPDSAGVVAAQSSFGALAAGQTYSVALTWDNANKFQLAVETAGVLISNLFTTVGTPGSWTGNGSLSVGTFSNPQFVGGLAGWNAVVSAPWDVTDAKNLAGTIHGVAAVATSGTASGPRRTAILWTTAPTVLAATILAGSTRIETAILGVVPSVLLFARAIAGPERLDAGCLRTEQWFRELLGRAAQARGMPVAMAALVAASWALGKALGDPDIRSAVRGLNPFDPTVLTLPASFSPVASIGAVVLLMLGLVRTLRRVAAMAALPVAFLCIYKVYYASAHDGAAATAARRCEDGVMLPT